MKQYIIHLSLILCTIVTQQSLSTYTTAQLVQVIKDHTENQDHTLIIFLLSQGVDVDSKDEAGKAPLHYAIDESNEYAVKLLLMHNANSNIRDRYDDTPLHYAAYIGSATIAALLLDYEAEVNAINEHATTPLHRAAKSGDVALVKLLLARGAQVNSKNKHLTTPLHRAADTSNKALIDILVAHGAQINAQNQQYWTPLHRAAYAQLPDSTAVIELLLSYGADSTLQNTEGSTVKSYLSEEAKQLVTTYPVLLERAKNPTQQLLTEALELGYYGLARLLLLDKAVVPDKTYLALVQSKYHEIPAQALLIWRKNNYAALGRLLIDYLRLTENLTLLDTSILMEDIQQEHHSQDSRVISKTGIMCCGLPKELVEKIARYCLYC